METAPPAQGWVPAALIDVPLSPDSKRREKRNKNQDCKTLSDVERSKAW